MRHIFLAAATICAALPAAATELAFYIKNPVYPLPGEGNFEVVDHAGSTAMRFWCDAGWHSSRLGGRGNTRIYVIAPLGRSQVQPSTEGVGFTIKPTPEILELGSKPQGHSLTVKKLGYNITQSHAQSYCRFPLF